MGSHGGEFDDGAARCSTTSSGPGSTRWPAELQELVDGAEGVALEGKPAGIAVHVRNAAPAVGHAGAGRRARRARAPRPGIEATPGKAGARPGGAQVSKGMALDVLRERIGADAVFFAGDDVTDETAFARLRPGDVGVKVGDGDTAAAHRVADRVRRGHSWRTVPELGRPSAMPSATWLS